MGKNATQHRGLVGLAALIALGLVAAPTALAQKKEAVKTAPAPKVEKKDGGKKDAVKKPTEDAKPPKAKEPPKKPETLDGPRPSQLELKMWGALSPRDIGRVIGAGRKTLSSCHKMAVKQGEAYVGLLPLQFKIAPDGKVEEAFSDIEEGQPDPKKLKACVLGTVRSWKFPKTQDKGPVIVVHPFVFDLGKDYAGGELAKTDLKLEHVPGQPLDLGDRRAPFHGRFTILGAMDSSRVVEVFHKEQESLKKCRSKSVRRGEGENYKLTMRWAVNPGGGASHIKALKKGEAMYKAKGTKKGKKKKGKKGKGKKKKRSLAMKDASVHAPHLTKCVKVAVGKWLFPRPTGGRKAIISVPLYFRDVSKALVEELDPPPPEKEMVVYEDE
jgi:hypothetical protein